MINQTYICSHCKGETTEPRDNATIEEKQSLVEEHRALPDKKQSHGYEYTKLEEPQPLVCYGCNPKRTSPYGIAYYSKNGVLLVKQ